jgi:hypothetical protein
MLAAKVASSVLATIAFAAIAQTAQAQPRFEVGGFGGGTSTSMHESIDCGPVSPPDVCPTDAYPNEGAHGVAFGAYLRFAVIHAVQLEANLMYAQKGYDIAPMVRMHYLELPVLVRIDPLRDRTPARLFAYTGLAPALSLGCHAEGLRFDNDTNMAVPYSDNCGTYAFYPLAPNRFDLSVVVGGGMGWQFPWGILELQARSVNGLIDNGTWGDGGHTVNTAFYVLAGFGRALAL